jgi:hypothetical protein
LAEAPEEARRASEGEEARRASEGEDG